LKNNSETIEHIYIHAPFCLQKCGYCSFYSEVFSKERKQEYLNFLHREIELFQKQFKIKPKTIYFGGGTPSLLSGRDINSILKKFDLSHADEITLEANPITIDEKYVEELSKTQVNRISLGSQSFLDEELHLLGRLHDAKQAEEAYRILRKEGFQNISFDLIYGLPNQTKDNLLYSLEKFISLQPEHISTYCLSLEKVVPMFPLKTQIPPDEQVSEFYSLIREQLLEAGYQQYEISNFAKPRMESKHNLSYWNDKLYLGLGPSASGYICHPDYQAGAMQKRKWSRRIRYANPADLNEYFRQIKSKQIIPSFEEIDAQTHEKEFIFLALRKTEGMNLDEFKNEFAVDFLQKYKLIIEKYKRQNLLEIKGDFIRLSPQTYFISNEIFSEFV
jgi:oxygen-independent coproporphyrinogen-3 oxidase